MPARLVTGAQVPFQVVLPEEALVAVLTLVAADLRMATVHMSTHMGPVKEPLVADITVELVGTEMEALVLDVAGIREEVLAADLAGLVRCKPGLVAA